MSNMSWVSNAVVALLAVMAIGVASTAVDANAPRRTALVIGNAAYETSPLSNPVNDARAMAARLRDVGFDVIERINVDQAGMKRAIWDYGKKLRQGGVGLFYFAGHGVQVGGENYLIPLKARIEGEPDLELEGVRVTRVLAEMEKANNGMNIVILDACRNNPFARSFRSVSRGLAHMSAPYGTLLAYATAPGAVAADGDGGNGLYTSELLTAIKRPGLRVEDVFKHVRRQVRKKSGGRQVPWESTSIEGDFYFIAPKPKAPPKPVVVKQAPVINLLPPPTVSGDALELAFWASIKDSSNPADFGVYLRRYPTGRFAGPAHQRLQSVKLQAVKLPAVPAPIPTSHQPIAKETKTAALSADVPRRDTIPMNRNFVTLARATLRGTPSANGAQVGEIPNATRIVVTGKLRDANWYRMKRRRGGQGFVHGDLVAPVGATEIAHWERIQHSRNADDFRRFLAKYPRSAMAPTVRRYMARAEQSQRTARVRSKKPRRTRTQAGRAVRNIWGHTRGAWSDAVGAFSGKRERGDSTSKQATGPLTHSSTPEPALAAADPAAPTFATDSYVRVMSNRLNVRAGPGSGFPAKFSVTRNETVQVTVQNGSWIRIQTSDGRNGWVAGWLVAPERTVHAKSRSSDAPETVTRSVSEAPAAAKGADPVERLSRLKRLHEQGLISDQEYTAKRQEILSKL